MVVSGNKQSLAQADATAFDGLGIDQTPACTGWRQGEGSPLAEGDSKRAWALHTDGQHPGSKHYQFTTPASVERQARRRWKEGVAFTFRAFTTPPTVTLSQVESVASQIECGPDLAPYGGTRMVTAVAITLVSDWSDETLWQDETFRQEFREEVADQAQVSFAKALRKLFALRKEVEVQ